VDLGVLNRGISASAETVYAYTGTHTSPTFLAAITNTGSFTVADGSITGTGLTLGVTAIALPSSADVAAYNGTLNFGTDRNLALTTINNPSNWVTQDASGDQSVDNIVPDAPFLTDPDSPLQGDTFTICFLPGTLIATPDGARAVEALAIGDLVRTQDGRAVAVKWIGRQTLVSAFRLPEGRRPVAIAAGALGENLPARELRLTSDHALLLDGVLVNAGALVNGTTIRRLTDAELGARCTVFHIETENHEVILAEGTPAETFIDTVTRARFDNFAEWQSRHGAETEDMAELDLPRAASARQVPHALRARIAAIAARRMAAAA
jgi:hypothetical protein